VNSRKTYIPRVASKIETDILGDAELIIFEEVAFESLVVTDSKNASNVARTARYLTALWARLANVNN
jgi:hypothetical protein